MLSWAAFSQIFGRRPVLLLALFLFALATVLCGAAQSFAIMLLGRSIQGTGAGGLLALTQVLLTDMISLRERGKYLALMSSVWAIGSISGPVLGGALARHGTWRWVFWMNLPIIGIGSVGIFLFLKLHYRPRSIREKLAEIDYIGIILFTASAASFLIPITWGGVMYSWSSWRTLVPLILGAGGLLSFGIFETKIATAKILPTSLFKNRTTSIAYFGNFLQGMILYSILYYLPLYFQGVKSCSPLKAGLAFLPQSGTVVPCAMLVGIVASKTGRYRWALWSGWCLTTLGCGLLCLLNVDTATVEWICVMLVSGVGVGLLFPAMSLTVQASSLQKDIAAATTLVAFTRAFGQTTGIAVGGVIFQNRIRLELAAVQRSAAFAGQYSLDAIALVETIKHLPPEALETQQLKTIFAKSLKIVWGVMCALSGIAMIMNFFAREYELDQAHVTEQGFISGSKKEEPPKGHIQQGNSCNHAVHSRI